MRCLRSPRRSRPPGRHSRWPTLGPAGRTAHPPYQVGIVEVFVAVVVQPPPDPEAVRTVVEREVGVKTMRSTRP
jgi:hypothetical protein